jgi:hypothetical protein
MPQLPHAHHKTTKRDSLNETKIKGKTNETVPDSNSNLTKSMTHHNQTKEWTTWFLNLPLMSPLTTKAQSLKFESLPHEAQLEDPKSQEKLKKVI